jgi:PLP dependent protein
MLIKENVETVLAIINSLKVVNDVTLVAVTKQVDTNKTEEVIKSGILDIGENRLHVAEPKITELKVKYPEVRWHFIGHLQRKKVRRVVELFDLIQSVDREELLEKIINEAKRINKKQKILLQVNVALEGQKQGFELEEIEEVVAKYSGVDSIQIEGLMMMAPFIEAKETKAYFKQLKNKFDFFQKEGLLKGNILSMGMSNDFEEAVRAGSSMVRIGTRLFQ